MTQLNTLTVVPVTGKLVRKEDGTGFIAEQGETVPESIYYLRRIDDGDLQSIKKKKKKGKGTEPGGSWRNIHCRRNQIAREAGAQLVRHGHGPQGVQAGIDQFELHAHALFVVAARINAHGERCLPQMHDL